MSSTAHERPRTLWEEGRHPGRDVVSLAVALLLSAAVLDLLLSSGLGLLYDLAFATVCVGAALAVRPADFFVIGVLPPLTMFAIVVLLAVSERGAIARTDDGFAQAVLTGLSRHGIALALGYAACLGLLAVRRTYLQRHPA